MVAGPDFTHRAVRQGDFFHLVTRHPHAALRHKLALDLGMQANAGHGRGKRWQQAERAGQTVRQPAPQAVIAESKAGRHQQRIAGFTERSERLIQQRPSVFVIQKAGDIHRAKLARVFAQDIQFRQFYLCRLGVHALATQ